MPLRRFIVGCALITSCTARAAEREPANSASSPMPMPTWTNVATEPTTPPLCIGDQAPFFTYLGSEGEWHESADLFVNGPVLMVFGATSDQLKDLDRARESFTHLGVHLTEIVDMRAGSAARLARRLRLSSPLMCDPVRAIAGLYGSLDPASLRHAPAYFLVDRNRIVRAARVGELPTVTRIIESSARALGRPVPEAWWLPDR